MREVDPNGKSAKEKGAKLDDGKPDFSLLEDFADALYEVVRVATFGAKKYSRSGWTTVPRGKERYSAALLRHYFMEPKERFDPDSGLTHAGHAAWNALARLQFILEEMNEPSKQEEGVCSGSSLSEIVSNCGYTSGAGAAERVDTGPTVPWRYRHPVSSKPLADCGGQEEKERDGVQGVGGVDGWKGYSFPQAK